MELKIEYLGVNDLTPYERNTRRHESRDVDEIVKSIERYGFDDPIGIWGDRNIIVEGHGRLLAAKILGMQTVPVIRLDHLTDEQRREYAIMHNRTAEMSRWDFEALQKEMAELHLDDFNFEMDETEITAADFDEGAELEEVAPTEPPEEPKSKRGQIYQLGDHRLMCGDSTNADDVRELWPEALPTCYLPIRRTMSDSDRTEGIRFAPARQNSYTEGQMGRSLKTTHGKRMASLYNF